MMNTRTNVAEHAPGLAGWLCLAASPVLAAMALLTKKRWLEWGMFGVAGVGVLLGVLAAMHV